MQFKDIIGQDVIKAKLIDTVKNKRISHAQLFLGNEGCGKLALAIAYAQYINCDNKQEHDSCGVCHSCIKFSKLIHPDLHFIFPNATTKQVTKDNYSQLFIKDFRELLLQNDTYINLNEWFYKLDIENKQGFINKLDCGYIIKALSLKSYESEYTIIIIWMAEKIYPTAAPKILKILEEPPEKTLFILISEDHENILSTIKSRAQLIKIPRLNSRDIENALIAREKCEAEKAIKISRQADGNYIEALRLLRQTEEEEFNFLKLREWMRLCFAIKVNDLNGFIDEISSIGREKQKQFFNYSLKFIREVLNFKFQENYLLKYEGEELIFAKKFSDIINENNINEISEELNKALYHIERNANPKIMFLDLSFKMNKLLKTK